MKKLGILLLFSGAFMHLHALTEQESQLIQAASAGNNEVVTALLSQHPAIDIDAPNDEGETALMVAAENGHTAIVQIVLNQGAQTNLAGTIIEESEEEGIEEDEEYSGESALMRASAAGHDEIVNLLLTHNADVNDEGPSEWTPLMFAADNGNLAIVKTVLQQGAEINAQDIEGNTALLFASASGYVQIVQELLEHNADITVVNAEEETALSRAVVNGHTAVVRLLFQAGADMRDGAALLTQAAKNGYTEIIKLLIQHGANYHVLIDEAYLKTIAQHDQELSQRLRNAADNPVSLLYYVFQGNPRGQQHILKMIHGTKRKRTIN